MILIISDSLSRKIYAKCEEIKAYKQEDIDFFISKDNDFFKIIKNIKYILEKSLYVTVKNIGFIREKQIFEAFVKQFGEYYGHIEYTDIKIECNYTGCKYDRIYFHNDDAIDTKTQPKYGFIQIQNEDPLKITKNYVVKVDDIVEYLKIYNENLLKNLFEYKIPMLSYGINYDSNEHNEIIINEPILYRDSNNTINVRFDIHRIKFFYWKKQITQPIEEKKLIYDFLEICEKLKKEIYLEKGDIFIHNNKRTLHDRSECSIELLEDGNFNTREIFVSFVK